jgi:ribosomal protein L24E
MLSIRPTIGDRPHQRIPRNEHQDSFEILPNWTATKKVHPNESWRLTIPQMMKVAVPKRKRRVVAMTTAALPSPHLKKMRKIQRNRVIQASAQNKCRIQAALRPCGIKNCSFKIHARCARLMYEEYNMEAPVNDDGRTLFICKKVCYNRLMNGAVTPAKSKWKNGSEKKQFSWTNDGSNGEHDPNCSEKALLDWLLVEGNY